MSRGEDSSDTDDSQAALSRLANTATLYIGLSGEFGSSVDYDTQERELSASCSAQGHVWNTDSIFRYKQCSVVFRRHATGCLREFADEHGLESACGSIEIAARLEPETFDAEGEQVALPPITIYIVLDDRGYDRTEKLLRASLSGGREASLSLQFSHKDFARHFVMLENLDLAAKRIYPIVSFSLSGTRQANTIVRVPKYKHDRATGASLTFTASGASIPASVYNSEFSIPEITLTGKLRSRQLGISSDDETLEIKEYEESGGWRPGYPEEAFPGVVTVSREGATSNCWVTLYATKDILKRLATLLSGMSKGDTVRFDVSMIAEGLPPKPGERLDFNVTSYAPVFLKSYV